MLLLAPLPGASCIGCKGWEAHILSKQNTALATVNAATIAYSSVQHCTPCISGQLCPQCLEASRSQVTVTSLPASHGLRDHKLSDAPKSASRLADTKCCSTFCLLHTLMVATACATATTTTNILPLPARRTPLGLQHLVLSAHHIR